MFVCFQNKYEFIKKNSVSNMKNNSTRSSCSNGNDSIINPETFFNNIKKLFGENSSTLHCQPAECPKRDIAPEYCHGKKKYDQHTLKDNSKCKGVSKKGTRIFESLHSALNENSCKLSSRCATNLSSDFQVQSNKSNNHKLKAYRYISDEFCPFCQKVPHKHTMSRDNCESYVSEDKRRKYKQFHNIPDKNDHEVTTCYLRIPKKYLIKNQGFSQKSISLNLDDNEDEYNIIIHKNSLPGGKENFRSVNRNNITFNCTTKHTNESNSGPSTKTNNWLERNVMHNEPLDCEYHLQEKHKNSDFSCKQHKKERSEHFNESIAVSCSTVKINYQIAPLLLMASAVSRQILQTAITNFETFILFGIFNKYQTKRPPQIPVTQDVSISCTLDNANVSKSLTRQQKTLECHKSKLGYSESLNVQFGKVGNVNNNAQATSDSENRNGHYIVSTNIYHGENSKVRCEYREHGEHNIQQKGVKVNDCDEICLDVINNSLFERITNIKDKFSTLLPQAYRAAKQILDDGLSNNEKYYRFGVFYKEELKSNVHDASVSCNLASEIDSEMMQLNTLLFKGMKQEFLDIFEISRKLKSSASEILGALNNFTKIPTLSYEDETENELYSQLASQESVIPDLSKIGSSNKFNSKSIMPNTEIKFKSAKYIDKVHNFVPLPYENLNIVFPSLLDKFHESQDICGSGNSQETEECINQNDNNDKYEERFSEQEQRGHHHDIKKSLDNCDKDAICSQQLRGELNNRQKNRFVNCLLLKSDVFE